MSPNRRRASQIANLRSRYGGFSEADYNDLLEVQEFACAICNKPETRLREDGSEMPLCVDHDHAIEAATGRIHVRGLLCAKCNLAIGLMDDPEVLLHAAEYIRARRCPTTEND